MLDLLYLAIGFAFLAAAIALRRRLRPLVRRPRTHSITASAALVTMRLSSLYLVYALIRPERF